VAVRLRPWHLTAVLACAAAGALARPAVEPAGDGLPAPGSVPRRIVAASVASAEVLLAIAPRERIAGVSFLAADVRYSAVADVVRGLQLVGADPEQILTVRPDLVVTDAFTRAETRELLAHANVPVARTRAVATFADVVDNIRLIGRAAGCEEAAERAVGGFEEKLRALAARAADVHGWRVLDLDGALGTYGIGSLPDVVLQASGAIDVAAERGVGSYRTLDVETILAWRPDALLIGIEPGEERAAHERLRQVPGLSLLPCVQRGRIVFVSHALLGSTSQHVLDVAAELQARLCAWGRP
jgi:iron complex transport system substrate-binding protein